MWKLLSYLSYFGKILPNSLFSFFWRLSDLLEGSFGAAIRFILISKRLKNCGNNVIFGTNIYIDHPKNLSLGSNVSIHRQVTILSGGDIVIGNNVSIAHSSSLISGNHTWENLESPIKYNPVILGSIRIFDDVWVGCGVRILNDIQISSRVVVAAGAVVNRPLKEKGVYGGVPAKILKRFE